MAFWQVDFVTLSRCATYHVSAGTPSQVARKYRKQWYLSRKKPNPTACCWRVNHAKGRISAYCLLHTVFPPTIVHTIFVSFIFSAGILNKSSDSMTRSAYFPGVIDPRFCSTKFANAPLIVYARIAVSRSIVC